MHCWKIHSFHSLPPVFSVLRDGRIPCRHRTIFPASTAVFFHCGRRKKFWHMEISFFWHMRRDHFSWCPQWFFPRWTPENSLAHTAFLFPAYANDLCPFLPPRVFFHNWLNNKGVATNHECVCATIVRLTDDLRFKQRFSWKGNCKQILKLVSKLKNKQKLTKLWVLKHG